MILARKKAGFLAAAGAALLLLGGCVGGSSFSTPARTVNTPTGIEGRWQESGGLYNASYYGNSFTWNDVNSGATLVRGSYTQVSSTDFSLQGTSAQTGQQRQVNCRLSGPTVLNCTRDDGQQFQMVRMS